MIHPETHLVTPLNGPRPAGPSEACFYCGRSVGDEHKQGCVARRRTVVVRAMVEYVVTVPEDWDQDAIEFQRNEGSWCADNGVREIMAVFKKTRRQCFCELLTYGYLREAEPHEDIFPLEEL